MGVEAAIRSFRDLRVWQAGIALVEQIYRLTRDFPRHELYGLASQMQRAGVSVPSNVAEGHAREHRKEYGQHLAIAQGSLAELETQLEIAVLLGYIAAERAQESLNAIRTLNRQLRALKVALAAGL